MMVTMHKREKSYISLILIMAILGSLFTACTKNEAVYKTSESEAFDVGWACFENNSDSVIKTKSSIRDINFSDKAADVKEAFVETKNLIVEKTSDGKEKLADTAVDIKETTSEKVSAIKDTISNKVGSIDTDFGDELGNILSIVLENSKVSTKELLEVCEGVITDEKNIDFMLGALASGITICCSAGKFGNVLINPQAKVVLALSYVALCTLRYGIKYKNGEIAKEDYAKLMIKDTLAFLVAIGVGEKIGEIIVAKVPSATQAVAVATQLMNA